MPTGQFDPLVPPAAPQTQPTAPSTPHAPPIGVVRRIFNIVFGSFLIFIGVLMIFIPGPGIAAILAGLNLVKPDNKISQYIRARMEKRKQDRAGTRPPAPPSGPLQPPPALPPPPAT